MVPQSSAALFVLRPRGAASYKVVILSAAKEQNYQQAKFSVAPMLRLLRCAQHDNIKWSFASLPYIRLTYLHGFPRMDGAGRRVAAHHGALVRHLRNLPISTSAIYLALGIGIGPAGFGLRRESTCARRWAGSNG